MMHTAKGVAPPDWAWPLIDVTPALSSSRFSAAPLPAPGARVAPLGHGEEETCASAALSEAGACPLARAGQARSRPPQANATTSTILSHTITLSSQHRASQLYPPTRAPVRNAPLLTPLCSAPRRPLPEPTCPSRGQVGSLCVSRPYAELPRFVLSGCSVGPPYGRGTACGATYSVEGVGGQGWPKTRVCQRNPYMDGCLSYRSTCTRSDRLVSVRRFLS